MSQRHQIKVEDFIAGTTMADLPSVIMASGDGKRLSVLLDHKNRRMWYQVGYIGNDTAWLPDTLEDAVAKYNEL